MQVHSSAKNLRLVTFDADGTLYADGCHMEHDNEMVGASSGNIPDRPSELCIEERHMLCACCMEHVCKIVWHQWVPAKASRPHIAQESGDRSKRPCMSLAALRIHTAIQAVLCKAIPVSGTGTILNDAAACRLGTSYH